MGGYGAGKTVLRENRTNIGLKELINILGSVNITRENRTNIGLKVDTVKSKLLKIVKEKIEPI